MSKKREVLWKPHPGAQTEALKRTEFEVLYGGARGGGKAQPLDSIVITPSGKKKIGELKVGDCVCSPTGGNTRVTGIYPQGKKQVCEIVFNDGSVVESTFDHLWWIHFSNTKRQDGIYCTKKILDILDSTRGVFAYVPLTFPVEYKKREVLMDPYLLGLILGDGYIAKRSVKFSTKDKEILDFFKSIGLKVRFKQGCDYSIGMGHSARRDSYGRFVAHKDSLFGKLKDLGLKGSKSATKFIPKEYIYNTSEVRLGILQGLMDTDGYIDKRGHMEYTSISKDLAQGVRELVLSLGGYSKLCFNGYRFRLYIRFNNEIIPFRLKRKRKRMKPYNGGISLLGKRIKSIKVKEKKECVCIRVEKKDGLYLTNDYTVTHNTDAGIAWLLRESHNPDLRALILRRNSTDLEDWIDRAWRMYSRLGFNKRGNPPEFIGPSGCIFRTGHLADSDSYTKYQGHEYQRILVEELTQIPRERDYLRILSSCRSTIKDLEPRVFATTNPGGTGHCVPGGEVLTPDGWKDISKIKEGDLCLTDVDGETCFRKVDQTIKEWYEGFLYKSDNWSARFECTPNHKIVRVTETKNKSERTFHPPSLIKVKNLNKVTRLPKIGLWKGKHVNEFDVEYQESRKKKYPQPLKLKGDDFCELMGWYLAEGSFSQKTGSFSIAQAKKKNRIKISKLLKRIGFHYNWNGVNCVIYSRSWVGFLSKFGKARDKYVPQIIKNATKQQLKLFYKTIMMGDGHKNHYYTISKQLADDMCEIGLKLGFRIYLSSRQRKNRIGLSYDVSFKENKLGWIEKKNIKKKYFKGWVYCLGIKDVHRFYLRQNGTVFLSGNSWVKKRFIDVGPWGEPFCEEFKVLGKTYKRCRVFIHATMDDNPKLIKTDPGYVHNIEMLKETDPQTYKAWRFGDWDVFQGQVFGEFNRDKHVIDPVIPSRSFTHLLCMDWGYSKNSAFAAYLVAIIPQVTDAGDDFNRVIFYKEFYGNQKTPDEWVDIISEFLVSNDIPLSKVITDPAMHNSRSDSSISIADIMRKRFGTHNIRVNITKGNNNRLANVARMHNWLSMGPDGLPYLLVTNTCTNWIRTIPMLGYDEHRVDLVDTTGEDHAYDSSVYLLSRVKYINVAPGSYKFGTGSSKVKRITNFDEKSDKFTIDPEGFSAKRLRKKSSDWRTL
jgi:hypothetical protein